MHRLENNVQKPRGDQKWQDEAKASIGPPVLIMSREELEQALQDSEMQEIFHNAHMESGGANARMRRAIIDRLFLWQSVNRSIKP